MTSIPIKLAGYIAKDQNGVAVLADATIAPFQSGSVDLVVCKCLSHHIPAECIDALFRESYRILKPEGTFVFLDALKNTKRFRSNVMWRYDRGSYPRAIDEVRALIRKERPRDSLGRVRVPASIRSVFGEAQSSMKRDNLFHALTVAIVVIFAILALYRLNNTCFW